MRNSQRPDAAQETSGKTGDPESTPPHNGALSALSAMVYSDTEISAYIIEHAPLLIVRVKPDGTTLYANKAACRTSGYELDEILEEGWLTLNYPKEKQNQLEKMMADIGQQRDVVNYELTIENRSGEDRIIRWHTSNLFNANGELTEIVGLGKDITEEKARAEEARQTAVRLAEAQRVAKIGSWEMDILNDQIWWSEESYRIFGFERDDGRRISFDDFLDVIIADDRDRMRTEYLESLDQKLPFHSRYRICVENQPLKYIDAVGEHHFNKDGVPARSVGTVRDVTAEVAQENKLREIESAARELQEYNNHVVENSPMFIVGLDEDGVVKHINRAGCEISGYSAEELLGKNFWETLFPDHYRSQVDRLFQRYNSNHILKDYETTIKRQDGEERILSWTSVNRHIAGRNDKEIIGVGVDITALKRSQEELEQLVHYDPLTDLPNRFNLSVRLELAIEAAVKANTAGALICVDVDRFKNINELSGHTTGDELLKAIASRLTHCMRQDDVVARLSGDEFAIMIQDIGNPLNVNRVVDKIRSAFDQRFNIEDNIFDLSASIGVSLFPDDGNTVEELFKNADIAMHNAKDRGGDIESFYTPELNNSTTRKIWIEKNLRTAMEHGELQLYFQPQVTLEDGKLIGAETLLRWIHPEEGFISPGEFIPVAESSGLIIEIGDWVLHQACQQAMNWLSCGINLEHLAVNIAGPQITRGNLIASCESALASSGLRNSLLELEVTEGFIMNDAEQSIDTLNKLHELGIPMSIDDFGTGYSSLSYLKRLPIDKLKVDQSFVRGLPNDKDDIAITKSIVSLGQNLGLDVIAEGVETPEQRDFLLEIGCEFGQGFYFYKPMPATAFLETFRLTAQGDKNDVATSSAA